MEGDKTAILSNAMSDINGGGRRRNLAGARFKTRMMSLRESTMLYGASRTTKDFWPPLARAKAGSLDVSLKWANVGKSRDLEPDNFKN
jgi:hypothetical protein